MYFVYLLKSRKDNRYYVGYSDNVNRRLTEHNSGMVRATKHRRPFILIGCEKYDIRGAAMWRERELKRSAYKRNSFIKNLTEKIV